MVICPSCGEENPARFRLCGFCGTALQAPPAPVEQRKTVSIVFSDLKGSTALGEQLDPETLRAVMTRYFDAMKAELLRHGGTIEKFIGDAIMAVFGMPVAHEDDALRAVRAADGMRGALERLNQELEQTVGVRLTNRTGVNTGEVITGDGADAQRLVTGDAVNTAARLEQAAGANEVFLGELTYSLVRDAVEVEAVEPLELKGKAERVPAYRLVRTHGTMGRVRRDDAPLVGREHELVLMGESFRDVVASGRAGLVTVVADAGTGKSRLVKEFTTSIADEAVIVHGRCLPYGDGITFWPLIEIVRGSAGISFDDQPSAARAKLLGLVGERDVAARVASVVGLASTQFPLSEIQWAARRLLELLAADRPVVAIVDDIHWAESAFLDLLEHVLDTAERPVLILATTRHDLFEAREGWGVGERRARLDLRPLTLDDAARVVDALLGDARLPSAVRARIAEASEGNPLYVEQFLSMLLDSGTLRREGEGGGEGWALAEGVTEIPIPPTIAALLAARLDRLARDERNVIEPACVMGLTFGRGAVEAMMAPAPEGGIQPQLAALQRKQLVREVQTADGTSAEAFRFAHLLVRDAAYATLLKRTRATYHERFVRWADADNALHDRAAEFLEILGWHLEQAYRCLVDLGNVDAHAVAIGRDAAGRLAEAGRRAYARGDVHAAVSLLSRAAELLPPDDPDRLVLQPDLAEVVMETGDFDRARAIATAAAAAADEQFDDRLAARARLIVHLIDFYTGGSAASHEQLLAEAQAAIRTFEREGDLAGIARAWRLVAYLRSSAMQYADVADAAESVMAFARLAGDDRLVARGAVAYADAGLYGPTPVPEAITRAEAILEGAKEDRRTTALVLGALSELYAMAGDIARGRDAYLRARSIFTELGNRFLASAVSANSWRVEWLAGDIEAATRELQRDHDALESMGERQLRSSIAATLAVLRVELGDLEAAHALSLEAEEIAEPEDLPAQSGWRTARARGLVARGDLDASLSLSREAVDLLRGSDVPIMLADALMHRSVVLRTARLDAEADAATEEAAALYTRKGDVVSAARAKAAIGTA